MSALLPALGAAIYLVWFHTDPPCCQDPFCEVWYQPDPRGSLPFKHQHPAPETVSPLVTVERRLQVVRSG